ncbi:PREDICTED: G-type lectin S-receptor [Prunus dulcis]|uniref:Receptor-like serine/threonine-protein kinase n=2 Tax=Prunus dulcis TaxID=3755 RepID=A0A5E4GHK6_PRUDU|nr:PREDICTED: G-type lectin S-receptor [Prunus dulcis]
MPYQFKLRNENNPRFSYLSMASSIRIVAFLLSVFSLGGQGARQNNSTQLISPGSSLSPISSPSSWLSPSGHFAFGFYKKGAGFAIGIWLVGTDKQTIVWTENRDDLPVTSNAILRLTSDGKLVLSDRERQKNLIVTTGTNSPTDSAASSASMLDSGNFVLYNGRRDVIWESFNHPTDTILGGQILPVGGSLISSLSENDHSTGRFHLNMQADGNLVLYSANSENSPADAYWSSGTYLQRQLQLYLNATGRLVLINSTSGEESYVLDYDESSKTNYKNGTIYRATLDVDGNFRLYSHESDLSTGKFQPSRILWQALDDPCDVKGFCGLNSYCTFYDNQPNCLCLPGTDYADSDRRIVGCLRNYTKVKCNDGKENTSSYHMITMENMVVEDIVYYEALMPTVKECSRSCLEDCNCGAAVFYSGSNVCAKQNLPLRYVRRDPKESSTAVFKIGNIISGSIGNNHNNTNPAIPLNPNTTVVTTTDKKLIKQIIVLTLALILFSCAALAVSGFYISKIRFLRYKRLTEINGDLGLADEELTLRAFSYNELRRATNGFKEELGKGSFGAVYKGALNKGKKIIAVKRLEKLVEEGEREFRAEMQAIGRTHHKNLVRLLGYSAEDSKRLLVYEYMSNGSLADLLFRNEWKPTWSERVTIALDVARGLLYLHEECKAPIIHCDIKPQNILMDEFWNAKISDFGLAKLLMPDQTRTFTGVRGTRGYLAPEWQKNTPISVKADVYSYGIVLLEIVCCRRNMDVNVRAEEIILSTWVYKCFVGRELHKLVGGQEVDKKTLENMVKVGLWCIQDEPALRPSMKSVVLMLQGITDIAIPPCPTATSM